MKGTDCLNYSDEINIWNSAVIGVLNAKHGLLARQEKTDCFESNAFLFAMGDGRVILDGLSYPIKSNCLLHIAANKEVTLSSEKDELEYYIVVYHADISPTAGRNMIADALRRNPFQRCYALRTSNPAFFLKHFEAMANEWDNITPLALLHMKERFYSIICALYTELSSQRTSFMGFDSFDYVYRYIQQNYSETISIQALADSLCIARSTLHKQFKTRIGISPQQYLMQMRLEAACRILLNSQMPIDEIAISCGLRDKSYFSRVFKEKHGIPPSAYRKGHAQNSDRDRAPHHIIHSHPPKRKEEYTLIENLGRTHRYFEVPRRIVCLDYSAAEICAALGVADRLTGVASAEGALADCAKEYRSEIAKAPFLPSYSEELNVPGFRAVCDCKPDIVVGTGYSFNRYLGVADAEDFEEKGIHIYAMKATYTLDCTYESVYEDIGNLGLILEKEACAEKIIQEMKSDEDELMNIIEQHDVPIRVFSFDCSVSDKALTCGQSLEKHLISSAGGINVFGDREGQFVAVDWHEVRDANPQVILVHCFHTQQDGLQKIAFLKQIPEIAQTEALRNNQIHLIGIKKVFPALDNLKTAKQLAKMFHDIQ